MLLLLTRHGRTASNVAALLDTAPPGPDLDEVGRRQAETLVGRLARYPIQAVYSSDLVRAVQTAQPLATAHRLPVTQLPGLREISGGDDELSPDLRRYIEALRAWGSGEPSVRIPGGENGIEFLARYEAAVRRVADDGHETAVLVSHGAAIRTWTTAVMPPVHAEFEAANGIRTPRSSSPRASPVAPGTCTASTSPNPIRRTASPDPACCRATTRTSPPGRSQALSLTRSLAFVGAAGYCPCRPQGRKRSCIVAPVSPS